MAHDTSATWGELVSDVPMPMTATELMRLPDDARGYELVEGRLLRMPPTGWEHGDITLGLGAALRTFVETHGLGTAVTGEPGFLVSRPSEPDTVLAPDVAFVRAERLPPVGSPARKGFLALAPDLVVEVVSPSQYAPEMADKARRWLEAGVRLIWVVWPEARQVDVWRVGGDDPIATLGAGDSLDGMEVVPGFSLPVARLFP
jgi:Uma2 family endonuclease